MSTASMRRIEFDDIQLLRYWRNLDHVKAFMASSNLIERGGQRIWFERLNPQVTQHFIYSSGVKDVGSVNLSKIDHESKTFEAGVYCGDKDFIGHWINVWACIQIYKYAFVELGLETSNAIILNNNSAALSLNRAIGYRFTEAQDDEIGRYVLTQGMFLSRAERFERYLSQYVKQ